MYIYSKGFLKIVEGRYKHLAVEDFFLLSQSPGYNLVRGQSFFLLLTFHSNHTIFKVADA